MDFIDESPVHASAQKTDFASDNLGPQHHSSIEPLAEHTAIAERCVSCGHLNQHSSHCPNCAHEVTFANRFIMINGFLLLVVLAILFILYHV